ncbi:microcystin degradation protein MlrC [Endozoicomonas sp. OPT23]|uniref:M81 family metallopeptidase n=1 Tax=Endozoicomonas sp. OPT23 TaxID=2072845 RepID=UPI00129ACF45|nr:M81 family metallopeptidase [Endozoicomonas sp. OPT23]MRI35306.1 microcystin degradation protein MlrC [Endozoicomonas sp. OPT23]
MHALLAMLKHETNAFSPIKTDLIRFQQWTYLEDEQVAARLNNTNSAIAGYLELAQQHNFTVDTPLAAEAMPSGPSDHETYWQLKEKIVSRVDRHDCLMLDLHGAMVTESTLDAEGQILQEIRQAYPDLPVAVSLDFHANISEEIVDNATVICGYHSYPHTDIRETGLRAGTLLLDFMAGKTEPVMSFGQIPLVSHTLKQGTDDEPFKNIMALCRTLEQSEHILDISFFGGFPHSDTPDVTPSIIVISDGHAELAEQVLDQIMQKAWQLRADFIYQHYPISKNLNKAQRQKDTVLLLDHSDNCGSGGTQDVMTVIEAVLAKGLEDVIVAAVYDPAAVQLMQVAGIDQPITVELGGKHNLPALKRKGKPLTLTGKVKTLTDGRWKIQGEMYNGLEINMGPTAVFKTSNMTIIVTSRHIEPWDRGIFIACGINPEQHKYILLKSRIHHRASFRVITEKEILLDGEGVTTSDYAKLPFKHRPDKLYPFNQA